MRSCKVSISGQVYHICRRNGIGESGRPLPTVSKHPCLLCLTVRSAKQRRRVPASGLALSALRYAVLNKGAAFPLPGSPSPSSLRDATSPKVRGLGSPQSSQFILYALLPQGEPSGAVLRLSAFAKGSPFGGAGAKRLRGQGRFRGGRAFVSQMLSVGRWQTRRRAFCPNPTKPTVAFCARCF